MKKGNFRFTERDLLPVDYRDKFLDYVDDLVPEVLESLKPLALKYTATLFKAPHPFAELIMGEGDVNDSSVRSCVVDR